MNAVASSGTLAIAPPAGPGREVTVRARRHLRNLLHGQVDKLVRQRWEERALHVEAMPPRLRLVVELLSREVPSTPDRVVEWSAEGSELREILVSLLVRPAVENRDRRDRTTVCRAEAEAHPELVGRGSECVAIDGGQPQGVLYRVDDGAERDRAVQRVEAKGERRRDPEVRPRTAQAPEELRVLVLARPDEAAVRRHELDLEQVVDREAVRSLQPAHPAAEGQSGDAGVRDHADGADEPGGLRLLIELREERAAGDAGRPLLGIHLCASHPRQVDDDAVVARRQAGDAVAAAPDGDEEILLARVPKGRDDVVGMRRPGDQRRIAVGEPVPNRARRVVARVAGPDDLAVEAAVELRQRRSASRPARGGGPPRPRGPSASRS